MEPSEITPEPGSKAVTVIASIIVIAVALPLYIHWFN